MKISLVILFVTFVYHSEAIGGRGGGRGRSRWRITSHGSGSMIYPSPSISTKPPPPFPSNSYLANNNFESKQFSGYLTNALFRGTPLSVAMETQKLWGSDRDRLKMGKFKENYALKWDEDDDRRWRATTKAPYFENKVPGADMILPASAVVGAATAFGLTSLFPLNVPPNKPLMYCNSESKNLKQAKIRIKDDIYECVNEEFMISKFYCLDLAICREKTSPLCDIDGLIHCTNGTLLSHIEIYCSESYSVLNIYGNETSTILRCHFGSWPEKSASFIPTTTTTQKPSEGTKELSFSSNVHIFLLKLMGMGNVIEKPLPNNEDKYDWKPEALTHYFIETTTPKSIWMRKNSYNGQLEPIRDDGMQAELDRLYKLDKENNHFNTFKKVILTTEEYNDN